MRRFHRLKKLSSREQKFIMGGGVIVLSLFFYLLVWSPLSSAVSGLYQSVISQKALHTWMSKTVFEIKQLKKSGVTIQQESNLPLENIVGILLQKENMTQYVNKIDENRGNVLIDFRPLPFDQLTSWLEKLWFEYGIGVDQVDIQRTNTQGLVRVKLLLMR